MPHMGQKTATCVVGTTLLVMAANQAAQGAWFCWHMRAHGVGSSITNKIRHQFQTLPVRLRFVVKLQVAE